MTRKHVAGLKRDPIKHVRDRAKSRYDKDSKCYVCGSTTNLDFHHFYSLSPLFDKWIKQKGLTINSDEDVLLIRDQFIEEHEYELFEAAVTICHSMHAKLHSIYGKDPSLGTAEKQQRWIDRQKEKYSGS